MTLGERFAKMEPRERTLLGGLAVAVGLIVFFFVPIYLYQGVTAERDKNQEMRDFIEKVRENRTKIDKKRAEKDAASLRYSRTMPPLASFLEEAAQENNITIDESQTRPDVPHGKKHTEHITSLKFKKIGMLGFVKMLEKVEKSNFPVSVTRLNIKPKSEPDTYDIEVHVSHYERKGEPKKEAPKETPEETDEE